MVEFRAIPQKSIGFWRLFPLRVVNFFCFIVVFLFFSVNGLGSTAKEKLNEKKKKRAGVHSFILRSYDLPAQKPRSADTLGLKSARNSLSFLMAASSPFSERDIDEAMNRYIFEVKLWLEGDEESAHQFVEEQVYSFLWTIVDDILNYQYLIQREEKVDGERLEGKAERWMMMRDKSFYVLSRLQTALEPLFGVSLGDVLRNGQYRDYDCYQQHHIERAEVRMDLGAGGACPILNLRQALISNESLHLIFKTKGWLKP